jgi:GTP-binding protein
VFIDEAKILVRGGAGGNGCMAFRREKFVPRGGPSGGDGGNGGSVILQSNLQLNTLLKFRYNPEFRAERGGHGEGSNRHGRNGEDLLIEVPAGTLVRDAQTGELLCDFREAGQQFVAARGGHGGRGNARFASSTNQAPRRADPGEPGEEKTLLLELKLLADVGLVGFPNAGKSTLLSRLSAAHPKIADYPFTTLEPCLGVVELNGDQTFVMADIPGLIDGASQGRGLGIRFLKHIERTRLLVHLIDAAETNERDPAEDYRVIRHELESFGPEVARKPEILVASRVDSAGTGSRIEQLRKFCQKQGMQLIGISAVTGEGLESLRHEIGKKLVNELPEASTLGNQEL